MGVSHRLDCRAAISGSQRRLEQPPDAIEQAKSLVVNHPITPFGARSLRKNITEGRGYKSIALECFIRPLGNAVLASCLTTEEFFQDVVHIEQQGDGSSVRAGVRHGSLFQVGYQFPNLVQIEGVVDLDGVAARHHN